MNENDLNPLPPSDTAGHVEIHTDSASGNAELMDSSPSHPKYRKIDPPSWRKGDGKRLNQASSEDCIEQLWESFPELLNESEFQIFTKHFPLPFWKRFFKKTAGTRNKKMTISSTCQSISLPLFLVSCY